MNLSIKYEKDLAITGYKYQDQIHDGLIFSVNENGTTRLSLNFYVTNNTLRGELLLISRIFGPVELVIKKTKSAVVRSILLDLVGYEKRKASLPFPR